jgi:coproporphyrinogen III oxidase-like Fe-S oxidoreductase
MKAMMTYKGKKYGYRIENSKINIAVIDELDEDDILDEEMKQQLREEFAIYEATLTDEEMRVWRGERSYDIPTLCI